VRPKPVADHAVGELAAADRFEAAGLEEAEGVLVGFDDKGQAADAAESVG
jgi:hypothetical protein